MMPKPTINMAQVPGSGIAWASADADALTHIAPQNSAPGGGMNEKLPETRMFEFLGPVG